jgi:Ser/Thr protein kinase RdoA (MazF antagonist)
MELTDYDPAQRRRENPDSLIALARSALQHYGLEGARADFICNSDNLVFRVDVDADGAEKRRFALRVYRPLRFSSSEIEDELRWVTALAHDAKLTVPAPVPGFNGQLAQSISFAGLAGRRQCALLDWVEGEFLTDKLEARHLAAVGMFMARLHEEGTRLAHAYDLRRTRRLGHDYLLRLVEAPRNAELVPHKHDYELLIQAAGIARARLNEAEQEELEIGLLHADLHQRNYLFTPAGVGAIDFCECCWGPYLHDIAVTLSDLHIDKQCEDLPALHEAFLNGYQQVRPLPMGYQRHIPTFLLARTLQVLDWIFRWPRPTHHAWGASYIAKAFRYIESCQNI